MCVSLFWSSDFWDQGSSKVGFILRSLPLSCTPCCVLTWLLCVCMGREGERMPWSLSHLIIRTPVLSDEGLPLWPHLTFITCLWALFPNIVTLAVRASMYEFWGDTVQVHSLFISWVINWSGLEWSLMTVRDLFPKEHQPDLGKS